MRLSLAGLRDGFLAFDIDPTSAVLMEPLSRPLAMCSIRDTPIHLSRFNHLKYPSEFRKRAARGGVFNESVRKLETFRLPPYAVCGHASSESFRA